MARALHSEFMYQPRTQRDGRENREEMRSPAVHLRYLIERAVLQRAMRDVGERTRDRLSLHAPRLRRQGSLAQKDNS